MNEGSRWIRIRSWMSRERVIVAITGLTVIVSLVYAFGHRIRPAVDAQTYHIVATNIAEGKGFRLDPSLPVEQDEIITYQGPLYEFALGGLYAITGPHPETAWVFHALLRGLSVLLLFLICQNVFGKDAGRLPGWIAASLFGFSPDLVEIGAMLMTETFFLFLSILTTYLFTRYFYKPTVRQVAVLTLAFGLTVLTRSTVGAFLPVFLFWLYQRRAFKHMGVLVGLLAIIMTPWAVRNWNTYHQFLPTMANYGYNFWVGNHVGGDGEGGYAPVGDAIRTYGVIDANAYALDQFKTFLVAHPFEYARLTLVRTLKYFSPIRPMGFWFYQTGVPQFIFVASSSAWSFVLLCLAFAGLFAWWMRDRKHALLSYLAVFSILTAASVIPILVETRYRMPSYPFWAIFAGYAAAGWWRDRKIFTPYLMAATMLVAGIGLTDMGLEWQKVQQKLQDIFHA